MYDFEYHRPDSAAAAVELLGEAEDGRFLAGGMSLLPALKLRMSAPSDLVDLGSIGDLMGIRVADGRLVVGAMSTHAAVAASADVRGAIPALAALAGAIGDPQVRNRGTLGGSIAFNDPAADYPAAVLGLRATVHTNQRDIPGDAFFTGIYETALEGPELIREVGFAIPDVAAYAKFASPASRYAVVGVLVARYGSDVRVAVTGASAGVHRSEAMERALAGRFAAESLDGISIDPSHLNEDVHASAEYRAHLVLVMAKRAVRAARG